MFDEQSAFELPVASTDALSRLRQGRSVADQSTVDSSQLTKVSSIDEMPSI